MRTVFAVLALLVALAARLHGINYHVDFDGGADDNHGTSVEAPWKHCSGDPTAVGRPAACLLVPGDTVIFKGGVAYVFGGATGIALNWSGEPGNAIVYDGNSSGEWGEGRAKFTDNRGAGAITAFAAAAARQQLVFKSLEIGPIGGAAELPADDGAPAASRFGGGLRLCRNARTRRGVCNWRQAAATRAYSGDRPDARGAGPQGPPRRSTDRVVARRRAPRG